MSEEPRDRSKAYEHNRTWRLRHPERRNVQRNRNYDAFGTGTVDTNSYAPWTAEDDRRVVEREKSDRELAVELGRTVRAIQHRRARLIKAAVS